MEKFLGAGIGTGAVIGNAVGGSIGGVAVIIGTFGCLVRTCTAADGREQKVRGICIFAGQDCNHKYPAKLK